MRRPFGRITGALTRERASTKERCKKIEPDFEAVDRLLVQTFLRAHKARPSEIVLNLDATDDPLHGKQEGRFFHRYYDEYGYLPLYIFCGDHLLCARLREANFDASAGVLEELARIVAEIREVWPHVAITIRADSGFCRDEIMTWCEDRQIGFVLGIARNPRLGRLVRKPLRNAKVRCAKTDASARIFKDLNYRAQMTWSNRRRVVAKAEALPKGENPRFIVTSFSKEQIDAKTLYEDVYCARGEMENKIKGQQPFLFVDRTSTHWMRSNQISLYLSSIAYLLMSALRRLGLAGTEIAKPRCDSIRAKPLKIGARLRVTFRRMWVSFANGCLYAAIFVTVYDNLGRAPPA